MPRVIPPTPDRDDQFFWDGVAEGRLLIQRCADCGTLRHPPLPMCGRCGSIERDALESAGTATVYSWILSHHPTEPDAAPRIVALVDLAEGIRIVTNLRDVDIDDVRVGLAVELFFDTIDGVTLPQFRPVAEGGAVMARSLAGQAVIAGIGHTEYSKDSGRTELQLAAEAGRAAIADAGLAPSDVDGLVTFVQDTNDELLLMRCLGLPEVRYWSRTPHGGAGANTTVQHAAMAVASGAAKAVLVYRAFNERSGRRFGQPNASATPQGWNWYLPFGLDTPAKIYALAFQRYMQTYGLTNADFGRYTVVARQHAATNPDAWFYERPITLDDHQASRWIVEPILRKLDCCQESDGGVALVVTTAERAADLPATAARIVAVADSQLVEGHVMFNYYHPDLAEYPEAHFLARQLYAMSGLGPDDIDAAMIYENFSPIVFMQLEALGFCGPGEAKDFIADGNISLGGRLPVNTHGGLLGEAYIHGVNNILEAVRQIRGTAANQVPGAEHVLVASGRSGMILGQV